MNVLMVSAGRRVELLRRLRAACGGRVVAVDIDPLAPALYHADVAAPAARVDEPGFVDGLADLCRAHEIGLVVPTTDRELPVLARDHAAIEAAGARVAIAPAAAVDTALDKLACPAALARGGVAPVPTARWTDGEPPPFEFPVVVKPRRGAAASGVRTIDTAAGWTAPPAGEEWIVQPLAALPEVTLDVLADERGAIRNLGARRRLKVRGGEVERAETVEAGAYLAVAQGITAALGLVGPFNFQVFTGGPAPLVGEINPRLGGGLPLSEHAGGGLLAALCAWGQTGEWATGEPRFAAPAHCMSRYDESVFRARDELLW